MELEAEWTMYDLPPAVEDYGQVVSRPGFVALLRKWFTGQSEVRKHEPQWRQRYSL